MNLSSAENRKSNFFRDFYPLPGKSCFSVKNDRCTESGRVSICFPLRKIFIFSKSDRKMSLKSQ